MKGSDIKNAVKKAVKRTAMSGGLLFKQPGVRILTYHSIGDSNHEMNVTTDNFRAQMEWLRQYTPAITFGEAADGDDGVAITFDDGYLDNYANAAPVLRNLAMPATFFVVAGCVGAELGYEVDAEASPLMSWRDLMELDGGGFEIGCHTTTHPRLSTLNQQDQQKEIKGAKALMEERLGHEIASFAYPFGSRNDYNQTSVELVREAGFRQAASNMYGVNGPGADRWALKRIWIDRTDTLETFKAKVDGRLDVLALLDSRAGTAARCALNCLLGA